MKKILSIILAAFLVLLISSPSWAMWLTLKKGTTSKIIQIPIYDSSSTTGGMLTGLTYNSSGLTAYYNREGAAGAATSITLATATKGTWATGGFVAVDGTNMPGWYELDIPDAALATGANSVAIHVKGATNMVPVTILIQLLDNVEADVYSEVTNVSYGLAKLVRSTTPVNTLDVSSTGEAGLDFSNIKQATESTTLSNITIPTVTAITNSVTVGTNNDKTGYTASTVTDKTGYSLAQAFPSNFSSLAVTAGGAVTVGTNNDKAGYTVATNQDKTGYTVSTVQDKTGYSLTQSFPTNFSALSIDVSGRMDLGKWVGNAPNALISGRVDSNAQVVGDKTGYSLTQSFPPNFSSMSITAGGAVTVGTNNDKTGYSLTFAEEDTIVDKVWDELRNANVASGSFGQGAASVQGNVTGSVNSVTSGVTVSTNNDKAGYRLSAAGVDDIWDESQSGHISAGTFGKYLDVQVSSIIAPSAPTVANAVWEETSNHVTEGTMGKKLNDAALAGNPWNAAGICDGLTAGQCLRGIKDSTDGDKEGADYTGIEKTIRAQR